MIELLLIMLWAATVENIVFTRGIGSGQLLIETEKPRGLLAFSLLLTGMMTVSALLCTPVTALADRIFPDNTYIGRPVTMIAAVAVVYALICTLLWFISRRSYRRLASRLAFAAFNGALLGCVLIMQNRGYDLIRQLGYALGGAVGFILAVIIVREGERRIAISRVPKAFKGFPAMLIYLGLVSLAVFSLLGHQLPT